jgi:uncharacterized protein YhdP
VHGVVNFDGAQLNAKALNGQFLHEPIHVNIASYFSKPLQAWVKQINFRSFFSSYGLKERFPSLKGFKLTGGTPFSGSAYLYSRKGVLLKGKVKPLPLDNLQIKSNLKGLGFVYPVPFNKTENSLLPTTANMTFTDARRIQLQLGLAKRLQAALLFKSGHEGLYSADLRFGAKPAVIQEQPGIVIDGTLPFVNLNDWESKQATSWQEKMKQLNLLKNKLSAVNLTIEQLRFSHFDVQPVHFNLWPGKNTWHVALLTKILAGNATIPDDFPKQAATIDLQHLYLPKEKKDKKKVSKSNLSPTAIPPLVVHIDDFRQGEKDYGTIDMKLQPIAKGLAIERLAITNPDLSAVLKGSWLQEVGKASKTELIGTLSSNNVTGLLLRLKNKSSLLAQNGYAQLNLNWPGSPFNIPVKKLNGSIYLSLKKGWVTDLGKATDEKLSIGKLLTLLSIRHLLFQFGDLTHQGYSFDSLTANLLFKNGLLQTNDLTTQGAVANVKATGTVDFANKRVDLQLAIAVNATTSLPVIATIVSGFNPIVGVATWVVDKVAHSALPGVATYHYLITGPWSKLKVVQATKGK